MFVINKSVVSGSSSKISVVRVRRLRLGPLATLWADDDSLNPDPVVGKSGKSKSFN